MKQRSTDQHKSPFGHIIMTPNLHIFVLTP